MKNLVQTTRRGDTLIEVLFAVAIFSLVAILSIVMMNAGVAGAERALEITTARSEINSQADAIRFIHSSYVSELTLPTCDTVPAGQKCQQFKSVWEDIVNNAISSSAKTIPSPIDQCNDVYDGSILSSHQAFIINTRQIDSVNNAVQNADGIVIRTPSIFQPAILNARLIYTSDGAYGGSNLIDQDEDSSLAMRTSADYRTLAAAEGIFDIAVKGFDSNSNGEPDYYDFYIQSCWYGAGANAPTSLDSVIRLYNPEGA